MTNRWFLWFWLRACGTQFTRLFNLAHWMQMSHDGIMVTFLTFARSRVHRRGSLQINLFKRSSSNLESLRECGLSLMSKRCSLKRENHFLAVLSPMILSPYTAQLCLVSSASFGPLLNSKRRICRKVPISPFCTPFSSVQRLHSLSSNDKTSICKLQNYNWTSNKKMIISK